MLLKAIPDEGVGVYLLHNAGYDFSTMPRRFTLAAWHREIVASQTSPGGFVSQLVTRLGAGTEITRGEFFDHGRRFATSYTRTIAGTAAQVADHLEEVFETTGSHGEFVLGHVVSMPHDLCATVEMLVPELQRRGRLRREYRDEAARQSVRRQLRRASCSGFGELFGTLAH